MFSHNPFGRFLGRLSVGRKLALIYLLDLTAVIYVSSILINEKFIGIDFARKELAGNAYIVGVRDALIDTALSYNGASSRLSSPTAAVAKLRQMEVAHGTDMRSAALNGELVLALEKLNAAPEAERDAALSRVLTAGRELLTRIGNQSNLILDPDLDSYYTMSLIVLRYPELLEIVDSIGRLVATPADTSAAASEAHTRYLILEGKLDATMQGIQSDYAEAVTAAAGALDSTLSPTRLKLETTVERFRQEARTSLSADDRTQALAAVQQARVALVGALHASWVTAADALDGMLKKRVSGFYQRMWMHLGTALGLLCVILTIVTFVARHIARPLRHLAEVTDEVRRSGDHTRRAQWHSSDEIGRLVVGFNEMLEQLDREREMQKELAASARAADAQRALVEATPIPIVVTAIPSHEVLHANPPADVWLGGSRFNPWKDGLESLVRGRFFQQLSDRGAVDEFEVRWCGGAEPAWAVLSARRVVYQGMDAMLTTFTPINHLKLMERRLELWAKVFEASSEGILIVDAQKRIITANRAFSDHTGYELQEVLGEPPSLMLGVSSGGMPELLWRVVHARGSWQGEMTVTRRDSTEYPAWLMVSAVRQSNGEISHYIFTSIDISDRKNSESRIRFLAEHDVLTELPNRSLCMERLRMAVQQVERSGQKVAVLFIDLDHFKDINDSRGHHVGDGLLRSVAKRLLDAVRVGDTVSRQGGDEFVIILNGVHDIDEVASIVEQRLIPSIRQAHMVDDTELHISCSVGIAVSPDHSMDVDELMRHADTAMYQAKAAGKDCVQFFTAEMTERMLARLHLDPHLRQALDAGQFALHYQPRVDAASGRLVAVEGLLRWQHPELGLVSPARFIPRAEETGLIVPIGAWVIDEACRQIAEWRSTGLAAIRVSINLSARQLRNSDLVEVVRAATERHGIEPQALELELTESMVMDDAEGNLSKMHALRELGVSLAIDDFGTGYSSLAYLNRLPIDKLKIDRSFVNDMLTDPIDRAITMAVISLGHTLGLKVVAEGVELEEQAAILRESGCDELQGYLTGRPMPVEVFVGWARESLQSAA